MTRSTDKFWVIFFSPLGSVGALAVASRTLLIPAGIATLAFFRFGH